MKKSNSYIELSVLEVGAWAVGSQPVLQVCKKIMENYINCFNIHILTMHSPGEP